MASANSFFKCSFFFYYYLCLFSIVLHLSTVTSVEFEVGGDKGWSIPPSKDKELFNDWASKNRFKINDTLRFSFKKDSVMEVTEAEYEKCRSSHPIFYSNNGEDTRFRLDRSGLFYFISGVSGHCERGVKMIIKVLEPETPPSPSPPPPHHKSAAAPLLLHHHQLPLPSFIFSLFWAIFM